jgi:hypothetical protein
LEAVVQVVLVCHLQETVLMAAILRLALLLPMVVVLAVKLV